jgi:hypothetical protein
METLFIYLLKSSGLLLCSFWPTIFCETFFFTSNRWFCWPVWSLPPFCLYWFSRRPFGWNNPATIDWSQIPVGIPVEKPLLRWIGFDCRNRLCRNSLLIRFGLDYYSLSVGKPFISRPISSLLTLRKNWRLFVFNTIVYNSALYSASELQNIIEHEKCTANKTTA